MSTDAQEVLRDAMQLTESERAEVAARLIRSLDPQVDDDYEASWSREISDRLEAFEQGLIKTTPWDEAIKEISGASDESA